MSFLDGRVTLFVDDCREVLRGMADNSVDSVVTDPPYHLTSITKRFGSDKSNMDTPADKPFVGQNAMQFKRLSTGFMGSTWDGGDIAFQTELWAGVLRVLKPGGYIMAFSGCRTYHRMACAIEDAGFITHPMFCWCFGSGFPKAHNLSKQLDRMAGADREIVGQSNGDLHRGSGSTVGSFTGLHATTAPATDAAREWDGWFYGTQSLKPALEPIYFGQKPFERGLNGAENVLKWGTGAINVAGCKVGMHESKVTTSTGKVTSENVAMSGCNYGRVETGEITVGRWPANLLLSWPADEYELRADITSQQRLELFKWFHENT